MSNRGAPLALAVSIASALLSAASIYVATTQTNIMKAALEDSRSSALLDERVRACAQADVHAFSVYRAVAEARYTSRLDRSISLDGFHNAVFALLADLNSLQMVGPSSLSESATKYHAAAIALHQAIYKDSSVAEQERFAELTRLTDAQVELEMACRSAIDRFREDANE